MAGDTLTAVRRALTFDDLMSVRTPIDIDASADGSLMSVVAQLRRDYVVPRLMRHGDALPRQELCGGLSIIDMVSGAVSATWDWPEKVWNARLSPSGDRVVATLTVDGATGLWSARLDGTSPIRLVDGIPPVAPRAVLGWTAHGHAVVDLALPTAVSRPDYRVQPPNGVTVDHLVNDPSKGLNAGAEYVGQGRALVAIDINTGATRTIVDGFSLSGGIVSPDGRWIACMSYPERVEMSSFATWRSVDIRSLDDGAVVATRDRVENLSYNSPNPVWNPASREVALIAGGAIVFLGIDDTVEVRAEIPFRGDRGGGETTVEPGWTADGSHLVVGDIEGGLWSIDRAEGTSQRIAVPEHEASVQLLPGREGLLLEGPGDRFFGVVRNSSTMDRELWSLSFAGDAPVQLPAESFSLMGLDTQGVTAVGVNGPTTNQSLYLADAAGHPPEIYSVDGGGAVRRVTDLNEALGDLALPFTERLWFDYEGERRTAFAFLPDGWSPDVGPIPFVVDAYPAGDLWGRTADRWDVFQVVPPPLLTAQGWGVLVVGATPARDAATRAELTAPVLAGVEAAVAAGMADERVAVVGQSAGSYLVNCAITVTSRFRAAISFNGLANLASHFGQLYVGPDGPMMHGTANAEVIGGAPPWAAPERYIEKSPLFHLDKVETPLLVVHGTGDMAAMVQGGDEMYVGLRRLGKYVEILRYHGEGHGPPHYTEPNRTHLYDRVVSFLDEHLR